MSAQISQSQLNDAASAIINDLPERSADIIKRRFGIGEYGKETLESIGKSYGITRERVRQIENEAINRLRAYGKRVSDLDVFYRDLRDYIEENGGLMRDENLLQSYLDQYEASSNDSAGFIVLVLSLGKEFNRGKESDLFHTHWYTKDRSVSRAQRMVDALHKQLQKENRVFSKDEIYSMIRKQMSELTRNAIFAYIDASKAIDFNTFDEYGLAWWPEVQPRGVRDKAYLVLKKKTNPLHFREITDEINRANFSARQAKPQTVHNELIKDGRFVLVGRGLYGLNEWGYKPGTVKDILVEILSKNQRPMTEEQIIDTVLKQRLVKPETIRFNLKSSPEFKRVEKDTYQFSR